MTNLATEKVLTVHAMDGQYLLESYSQHEDPWPDPCHGLTTGEDSWIAILTGTHYGPIAVYVQVLDAVPEDVADGWDMVGERDIWSDEGGLRIHDLYSNEPQHRLDVRRGPYRVRIHVAGRADAAALGDTNEPIERHFIQLWPTTENADPTVLVGPDSYGTSYGV